MPLQFRHASIARSPRISGECVVGWTAHYVIGITFAFAFIVCTSGRWVEHPTLLPVLVYGIGTAIFPLFLLQPALGLGIASSQTPSPGKAVVKSLATHSVFGLGMYFCAIAFTSVAGVYP